VNNTPTQQGKSCNNTRWQSVASVLKTRQTRKTFTLTPSLRVIPANIAISDLPLKLDSSGYISFAECIGVYLQPLLRNRSPKLPSSAK